MCKINGHSIFSYWGRGLMGWKELFTSKKKEKERLQKAQEAEKKINENSQGEEIAKTASTAKMDSPETNKTLSSLRVPLEADNIGTSLPSNRALGLNLGG